MTDILTERSQPEHYEKDGHIKTILAEALSRGNLRIVLGAGASIGCGLPNWPKLIQNIAAGYGIDIPDDGLPQQSKFLFKNGAKKNRGDFAEAVRKALFLDHDGSITALSKNALLAALGAMSMAGIRGGVTEIVTFNFDDLLDRKSVV